MGFVEFCDERSRVSHLSDQYSPNWMGQVSKYDIHCIVCESYRQWVEVLLRITWGYLLV
jgi:hypothetical protein